MNTHRRNYMAALVIIVGTFLFSSCENVLNPNAAGGGETGGTGPGPSPPGTVTAAAEIPAPVILGMFGLTENIFTAIEIERGAIDRQMPAGITVSIVEQTTETWVEADVTFSAYSPADPPEEFPDLTIGTGEGETINLTKTSDGTDNTEAVTLNGSLTISGYDFPSFTYDAVTVTTDTTAEGEMGDLPLEAEGTITAGDDEYAMSSIVNIMADGVSFSTINAFFLVTSLWNFLLSEEEGITGEGFTIAWIDRENGQITMDIDINNATGTEITGEFDIVVSEGTGTFSAEFDGAMSIDSEETPARYIGLNNVHYSWTSVSETGPDGPPDSASGTIIVDTTEYGAAYLVDVVSTIMTVGGVQEQPS